MEILASPTHRMMEDELRRRAREDCPAWGAEAICLWDGIRRDGEKEIEGPDTRSDQAFGRLQQVPSPDQYFSSLDPHVFTLMLASLPQCLRIRPVSLFPVCLCLSLEVFASVSVSCLCCCVSVCMSMYRWR